MAATPAGSAKTPAPIMALIRLKIVAGTALFSLLVADWWHSSESSSPDGNALAVEIALKLEDRRGNNTLESLRCTWDACFTWFELLLERWVTSKSSCVYVREWMNASTPLKLVRNRYQTNNNARGTQGCRLRILNLGQRTTIAVARYYS